MDPKLVEDILSKADIVSVISSYLKVEKKGRNYVALCPFHDDSNPSLSISPERQIFKCFVCGTGGNAIGFIEKYEKIPFEAAVRKLAQLIGYSDPRLSEQTYVRKIPEEVKRLYDCIDDLQSFYSYMLNTPEGKAGKDYLAARGIDDISIKRYRIGYSPSDGEKTIEFLKGKGHSAHSIEGIGIADESSQTMRDRNAGRVIFPLLNSDGQVVGFSARKIKDDDPSSKYINSPETRIFQKSRVLYNYSDAAQAARRDGYVYVLEGFMDVIALNRSGIESAVALMGTSLTPDHINMLSRLKSEVRLCLDGDAPGQTAMMKCARLLRKSNVPFRLVDYQGDLRDPDDVFQEEGAEAVKQKMSVLVDPLQFELGYYTNTHHLDSTEQRSKLANQIIPYIRELPPGIEREDYIVRLAKATGFDPGAIREMVGSQSANLTQEETILTKRPGLKGRPARIRRLVRAEQGTLYHMAESKQASERSEHEVQTVLDDHCQRIATAVLDYRYDNPAQEAIDVASLMAQIELGNPEDADVLNGTVSSIFMKEKREVDSIPPVDECIEAIGEEREKARAEKTAKDALKRPSRQEQVAGLSELVEFKRRQLQKSRKK